MRAITVKQPWAWAIAHGGKLIENRVSTSPCARVAGVLGLRVAIHAGKSVDHSVPHLLRLAAQGRWDLGAVVAVATVCGVVETVGEAVEVCEAFEVDDDSAAQVDDWYEAGAVGIVLRDVIPLTRPVPAVGRLGWWRVPADVEAEINRQIGASP